MPDNVGPLPGYNQYMPPAMQNFNPYQASYAQVQAYEAQVQAMQAQAPQGFNGFAPSFTPQPHMATPFSPPGGLMPYGPGHNGLNQLPQPLQPQQVIPQMPMPMGPSYPGPMSRPQQHRQSTSSPHSLGPPKSTPGMMSGLPAMPDLPKKPVAEPPKVSTAGMKIFHTGQHQMPPHDAQEHPPHHHMHNHAHQQYPPNGHAQQPYMPQGQFNGHQQHVQRSSIADDVDDMIREVTEGPSAARQGRGGVTGSEARTDDRRDPRNYPENRDRSLSPGDDIVFQGRSPRPGRRALPGEMVAHGYSYQGRIENLQPVELKRAIGNVDRSAGDMLAQFDDEGDVSTPQPVLAKRSTETFNNSAGNSNSPARSKKRSRSPDPEPVLAASTTNDRLRRATPQPVERRSPPPLLPVLATAPSVATASAGPPAKKQKQSNTKSAKPEEPERPKRLIAQAYANAGAAELIGPEERRARAHGYVPKPPKAPAVVEIAAAGNHDAADNTTAADESAVATRATDETAVTQDSAAIEHAAADLSSPSSQAHSGDIEILKRVAPINH